MKYTYKQIAKAFKEVHEGEDWAAKDILDSLTWLCSYKTAEELVEESVKGLAQFLDGTTGIPGYKTRKDVENWFEDQYDEFENEEQMADVGFYNPTELLRSFFKEEEMVDDEDEDED